MPNGSLYTLSSDGRTPSAVVAELREPSGPVPSVSWFCFFTYAKMATTAAQPAAATTANKADVPVSLLPDTSSARLA